jgi:glucosamine--fructose-6-phosphate aminotransferase (isomerizing)
MKVSYLFLVLFLASFYSNSQQRKNFIDYKDISGKWTICKIIHWQTTKINDEIISEFKNIESTLEEVLKCRKECNEIAEQIYNKEHLFFIGRGIDYALCMEGSLKLKEISYIHSESYPAGELKHGTISLIEPNTPVIAIATDSNLLEKTISNIKEVKARGAYVIYITTRELDTDSNFYDKKIVLPTINTFLKPIITLVPLQLIAYETAKMKGLDIDKPRNLAKSVTVE